MKNSIFFTFLFISVFSIQAQQKEIKSRFLTMQNALVKRDFSKVMDYTTEEIFKIVPKNQMVKMMQNTFDNPQMEIEVDLPKVLSISDVFTFEDKNYAILETTGIQRIRVSDENKKQLDLKNPLLLTLKLKFDVQYGPENVTFNDMTKFFTVVVEQKVVAIAPKGDKEWKFLVMDKNKIEFLSKLLPEEVAKKI